MSALDFLPDFPFLPRITLAGRLWLQCPSCGWITLNKVLAGQHRLRCYHVVGKCRHRNYGFGIRLYPITTGVSGAPPPDFTLVAGLREAFPTGEMFRWRGGEMAHQLVPGGREYAREFVRQVRSRASSAAGVAGLGASFEYVAAEWGLELDGENVVDETLVVRTEPE